MEGIGHKVRDRNSVNYNKEREYECQRRLTHCGEFVYVCVGIYDGRTKTFDILICIFQWFFVLSYSFGDMVFSSKFHLCAL
jgi:hypothetical protein